MILNGALRRTNDFSPSRLPDTLMVADGFETRVVKTKQGWNTIGWRGWGTIS